MAKKKELEPGTPDVSDEGTTPQPGADDPSQRDTDPEKAAQKATYFEGKYREAQSKSDQLEARLRKLEEDRESERERAREQEERRRAEAMSPEDYYKYMANLKGREAERLRLIRQYGLNDDDLQEEFETPQEIQMAARQLAESRKRETEIEEMRKRLQELEEEREGIREEAEREAYERVGARVETTGPTRGRAATDDLDRDFEEARRRGNRGKRGVLEKGIAAIMRDPRRIIEKESPFK